LYTRHAGPAWEASDKREEKIHYRVIVFPAEARKFNLLRHIIAAKLKDITELEAYKACNIHLGVPSSGIRDQRSHDWRGHDLRVADVEGAVQDTVYVRHLQKPRQHIRPQSATLHCHRNKPDNVCNQDVVCGP
jgi:hypothetical protein